MAINFGFFGSQEHRTFNYKPRYYYPQKEELRRRFGAVDGSDRKEGEAYVPGSLVKGSFRDGNYQKTRKGNKAQSIIGLAGLILFMVVLIYITKFYQMIF